MVDLNGINLSNQTILWNDPANTNWLEQFNTIVNATLINSQKIGRPGNSQELLGVLTSEYAIQIPSNSLPVIIPCSAIVAVVWIVVITAATLAPFNALKT